MIFLGRLEGERKFFLRWTRRNHLDYLEVKEDFSEEELKEKPTEAS